MKYSEQNIENANAISTGIFAMCEEYNLSIIEAYEVFTEAYKDYMKKHLENNDK